MPLRPPHRDNSWICQHPEHVVAVRRANVHAGRSVTQVTEGVWPGSLQLRQSWRGTIGPQRFSCLARQFPCAAQQPVQHQRPLDVVV